ncbi:MAG: CPBP family intramembrane glutamic endopeptidase [Candidatus Sulfotelmatobacter sp.]
MASIAEPSTRRPKPSLAAPLWHTLGLLIILLAISAGLYRMQSRGPAAGEQHHANVVLYVSVIVAEWTLSFYIWLGGLSPAATRLRDLVGGRWDNLKAVLLDIAVAAAFWIVWTALAIGMNFVLGPSHTESLGFLNPRGVVEVTLWVMMSMTAGFCEELVYRGYLQKQFLALTGSAALAVLAQAVLFGVGHWYQGGKQVITITVLGLLFGILAHWRKSLRPGMLSHAWSDVLNVIPIRFP